MDRLEAIRERLNRLTVLLEQDAAGHARWLDMTSAARSRETGMASRLQAYFVSQINRLNNRLTVDNWKDAETLLDWEEESKAFRALIYNDFLDVWAAGYAFAQSEVNQIKQGRKESVRLIQRACRTLCEADPAGYLATQGAIQAVEEALEELSTQISGTTREQIKADLRKTIETGGSVDELRDEIVNSFQKAGLEIGEYRAALIAQTELIRALNAGARRAYEDSGFLKDPSAQFDVNLFNSKGDKVKTFRVDAPPAHPDCRCTIALDPDLGVLVWYTSLNDRVCPTCMDLEGSYAA